MIEEARSSLRQIRGHPGFACAVIVTLALSVGAPTAVFTLADPMLFRPLPYPEADRVVRVRASGGDGPFGGGRVLLADFERATSQHRGFEAVADFSSAAGGQLEGLDATVLAYAVTPAFFDVLRLRPMLGRTFLPEEHRPVGQGPGAGPPPDVALITHELWQAAFGGTASVVGQTVELAGPRSFRYRVVGVLPRDFVFPDTFNQAPGLLLPGAVDPARVSDPRFGSGPIARLRPGVSLDAATDEMQAIFMAVEREHPTFPQGRTAQLIPLQEALFGSVRTPLLMLLGATACVFLLACANLAHLFMARLRARRREFGIRLACGAGRWRLSRLLVVEAATLAALGGLAAVVVGQWTFNVLTAQIPPLGHVYRLLPAALDWRVAGFAAVLVAGALVVFGVMPALRAARADVRDSLQSGGPSEPSRRGVRSDDLLIVAQTSVSVGLLVTAALIVGSFVALAFQPLGYQPQEVRTITVELADTEEEEPGAVEAAAADGARAELTEAEAAAAERARQMQLRRRIYERLRERLPVPVAAGGGVPGLTLPMGARRADGPESDRRLVAFPASSTFLDVFGVTLLRGRMFDDGEAFSNAPVAVVDQRAAEMLWPGEDAIGKQIRDSRDVLRTVIGVTNTLQTDLRDPDRPAAVAFLPFDERARPFSLCVRPGRLQIPLDQVRAVVHEVAPQAVVGGYPLRPFERVLGQPRFLAVLLGTLGVLTIVLTLVGVFGVVNHEAARRTREVGIRMSLGADAGRIRWMVLRRALGPAAVGVAAGLGASLWWTRTLQSLLFELSPQDPVTFGMTACLLLACVALASLIPAWTASRLDPAEALRAE